MLRVEAAGAWGGEGAGNKRGSKPVAVAQSRGFGLTLRR